MVEADRSLPMLMHVSNVRSHHVVDALREMGVLDDNSVGRIRRGESFVLVLSGDDVNAVLEKEIAASAESSRIGKRSATLVKLAQAQTLVDQGRTVKEAATEVGLAPSTVSKGVNVDRPRGRRTIMKPDQVKWAIARLTKIPVSSLAEQLGVSESTLRRAINAA